MQNLTSIAVAAVLVVFSFALTGQASAASKADPAVQVEIDISDQVMSVRVNGWSYGKWKVSTARDGYHTPRGSWRPIALAKEYYSKKYDDAPMPNSIFFYGGYAIHGTYYLKSLGHPASHGCVRLAPDKATALFNLVKKYGMDATRIVISD
jgi:lipoprotein-anchoring transpeptidase ErfK/SrfK